MCIAILNVSGTLTDEQLSNSWSNNPQGAGLLWSNKGKLNVFKTFKRKELVKKYKALRADTSVGTIVLHFRISTSGKHNHENLHPFTVSDSLAFVHNGIIQGLGDSNHSDTYHFNELLKQLPSNFLDYPFLISLLGEFIGWSKLIFLRSDGSHHIIGTDKGSFDALGNWYSNDGHQYDNDFVYYGNEKRTKSAKNYDDLYSLDEYTDIGQEVSDLDDTDRERLYSYLGIRQTDKVIDIIDMVCDSMKYYNALSVKSLIHCLKFEELSWK